MRIAGTNIPAEKRIIISLTYVYGVGPARSKAICEKAKIDESIRIKDLTTDQEELLRKVLTDFEYNLESDLRREISQDIKRLQDVGSYRGFRHRRKLPVRGQRTKTNSRTKRGKRGTVANKKKITR
ncbi:30S ribosomal protein S13 [Candidatus Gracilibacteria bacterium]|nr:30S ribosomal protein S13 [Candidatus Gracilibacteria bacterium]